MVSKKLDPNIVIESISWFDKIVSDKDFFSFLEKHQKKIEHSWNEIFLLVDEEDGVRRSKKWLPLLAYRSECHKKWSKNFIHRAADFLVINHTWNILLSKRAEDKDTCPGFWETWWGHCWVLSYEETLKKELKEELWVSWDDIISTKKLIKWLEKTDVQWQYNELYQIKLKNWAKISIDNKEVKKSIRYPIIKIIEWIENDTLNIIPGQKKYILQYILQNKLINDSERIKKTLKKQKVICEKNNIYMTNVVVF